MSIETGSFTVMPRVTLSPFPASVRRFALNGSTMGTRYAAIFFAAADIDHSGVHVALQGAVDVVDQQMSTWKADSDVSRLNAAGVGEWVDLPRALIDVLSVAMEIGRVSNGAFDIGVGDLVNAWGFGPRGRQPNIDEAGMLATRSRRAAMDLIEIDHAKGRARKSGPVDVDLSGIAKGFGVDQLARCLDGLGIGDYLVSIDGEMRARGRKPEGTPWIVAVEKPDTSARDIARLVELSDVAIATSGDYRHWMTDDGQTLSHTMDPRTGRPLVSAVASVTVVAEECVFADAWATAFMVLGDIEGPRLAEALGLDALFIVRERDGFREISVGRLAQV